MEDALARSLFDKEFVANLVLILVVMEDALALPNNCRQKINYSSLNPCCNGRCTRTG